MNLITRLMLVLASSLFLAASSGCVTVAVGAAAGVGTYAYMQGRMTTTFDAPLDRVWAATQAAIAELEFDIDSEDKDALQGRMVVRQADGTRIRIYVEQQTDALTDVIVRVGVFGDEAKSRLVLDKIRGNL